MSESNQKLETTLENIFFKKSDFASVPWAVSFFEPAAFLINKGAKKLWKNHRKTARLVCALQYLTNPIDRAIQALATPLFTTFSFIYATYSGYGKKFPEDKENSKWAKAGYLVSRAAVFLPTVATKTVVIWITLAANTAIHLFPFKVISACKDNRPANFTARREYQREGVWPGTTDFGKHLVPALFLLGSDKIFAQGLPDLINENSTIRNPLYLFDKTSDAKHLEMPLTEDVLLLIDELRARVKPDAESTLPADEYLAFGETEGDRLWFIKEINFFFFHPKIEHYSYFKDRAGFDSVFFLPNNMTAEKKAEELTWRYNAFLLKIRKAKEGALTMGIVTNRAYSSKERYNQLIELEAVIIFTYEELTGRAQTKSASSLGSGGKA